MSGRAKLPLAVTVEITSLTADGFGEGCVEGRRVRLRNALPGETVEGQLFKRRKGYWLGEAGRIVGAPSTARVPAPCPVAARCGGCGFQHVADEQVLAAKAQELRALLDVHEVHVERWLAPVAGPRLGYRRKARLGVRRVGEKVFVGFREALSGRVVDMTDCAVLDPRLAALVAPLREVLGRTSIAGLIPQVELAAGDRSCAIVIRHLTAFSSEDLVLLTNFAVARNVAVYLQGGGEDSVAQLAGPRAPLGYANPDFGLHFEFQPLDFVQVNAAINRRLVRSAVMALAGTRRVADLFCGMGNFSLPLARSGIAVAGVEAGGNAVDRARHNAVHNALADKVDFSVADLYEPDCVPAAVTAADALLLDPPRTGAGANLPAWLHAGVERVVYVSCNPVTFAADAAVLAAAGFQLAQAGVYDMFPQTAHVETLGVFRRVRGAG
ncbi:MAG: 23S rRNA (uracil(1939)-C(5))-methyltransferase RlmD [Pseudomonadales bacterium]